MLHFFLKASLTNEVEICPAKNEDEEGLESGQNDNPKESGN